MFQLAGTDANLHLFCACGYGAVFSPALELSDRYVPSQCLSPSCRLLNCSLHAYMESPTQSGVHVRKWCAIYGRHIRTFDLDLNQSHQM